jgi:prepilin-type N-terminal cleavage/methylation domain-containing protein
MKRDGIAVSGALTGGFTLVEVMVSLAIMTVGAAGLFSLQGLIARSNLYSRHMTSATEAAETWIERLKADAIHWNAAAPSGTPADHLTNTRYLISIANNADTWVTAGSNANLGHSPAFDLAGRDVELVSSNQTGIYYCVAYRLGWVVPGESIRADVRVFWPHDNVNFAINYPLCTGDQNALNSGGVQAANFHAVYASTVLRWNPLP